jgi:hypothetical protein
MDMRRLKHYVDLMREFGFNSLQLSELWENYEVAGWQIRPRAFRAKLGAIADYARSRGMRTTLFVWGTGPIDPLANKGRFEDWHTWDNVCACVKGGRRKLTAHYRSQAELAKHFDHFITHWADPGGCQGGKCTIETAMRLHNEALTCFRKVNPDIRSTFSLWLVGHKAVPGMENWRGYRKVEDVLDAGILAEDAGLAQGGRFRLPQARVIAKAGRELGVWAWYLADMEIFPSLHVHTNIMKDYFGKLPREAARLVSWHTIDSNSHVLNLPSLYVAAQLLKDPYANLDEKLAEFCCYAFGEPIAAQMAAALSAIASTRCRSDYMKLLPTLTGRPFKGVPDEREEPERQLAAARRGLQLLRGVSAPRRFKSPLSPLADVPFFIEAIRAHLEQIVAYAQFRARLESLRRSRRPLLPALLPAVKRPGRFMTQFEYRLYKERIGALEKAGR